MLIMTDTCWGGTGSGVAGGYRPYVYPLSDPPSDNSTWPNVAPNWATIQGYPVPENLAYSNTALQSAGSDGFALGDLNWFPAQLALWHPTGVKSTPFSGPENFALSQNYPNPFNPSTTFNYVVGKAGFISIKVYDLLGREVATLVNEVKQAGTYPATWNAAKVGTGVYFYKMQSGSFTATKKMVLMK
jgi:hypothetical protein